MTFNVVPIVVSAFLIGTYVSFAPYTSDIFKKWIQTRFMCPKPGNLGMFVEPEGPEAIMMQARKVILGQHPEVPVNTIVLVVSYDGNSDEAVCNWNNKLVVLPRRWIRKIK